MGEIVGDSTDGGVGAVAHDAAGASSAPSADERREILLRYANDSVVLFDEAYQVLDCNDRALEMFGYTRDELLGLGISAIRAEQESVPLAQRQETMRIADSAVFESVGRRKDGATFPIETSLRAVDSEHGRLYHATIRDISERKRIETELRRSRALLTDAEGVASIGHWNWNRESDTLEPSPALLRLFGVAPDSPDPAAEIRERIHPDDREVRDLVNEQIRRGEPVQFTYRITGPGGDLRYIEGAGGPLFDGSGEVVGVSGIALDVTERKAVAEALGESEERYRSLFASMMEGFAYCRMVYDDEGLASDWIYLSVNPAFAVLTDIEDAVGRRVTELFPGIREQSPELFDLYARVVETGEPAEFDIDFRPLDKWLHVSATRPREGEFVALFTDISQRKWAEAEVHEQEQRLRLSLAAAGAGSWEWEITNDHNTWSDELWTLYDLDPATHEASYASWLESVVPEDRGEVEAVLSEAVSRNAELDLEWRVNTRDGSVRWVLSHGSPELNEHGTLVRYRGVVIDVTDRKRIEQALRESETEKRIALDAAGLGVWRNDLVAGRLYFDEVARRHYGLGPGEVTRDDVMRCVHPEDVALWREAVSAAVDPERSAGRYLIEYRVLLPDGRVRWLAVGTQMIFEGDGDERHATVAYGTSQDITARKAADQELQEREESYSAIFNESPYAMGLMTLESLVLDANDAFFTMLGGTREDILGRTVVELGLARDEDIESIAGMMLRAGSVRDLELARVRLTGEPFVVSMNLNHVTIGGQERVLAVYRDITEQKQAERELTESRAKLEAALSSMSDAVFISDVNGTFIDFNDAFATFHKFPSREACAKTLADYPELLEVYLEDGTPAPLDMWAVSRALRGEVVVDAVYGLRRKDTGEEWMGSYSFSPIRDDAGEIVGSVVVGRDITDRRVMDQALRKSEAAARETVERLSRAQRLGHIGDWVWDVATGDVFWSDEVYRIYGVEEDFPTTFDAIVPLVHPDDNDANLRRAAEFVDDPHCSFGFLQFRIVRPDGDVRHIFQTLEIQRDADGKATRVSGLQQDVTELRETEEALTQSEHSLRRFYDAGLVGVAFWTLDGRISDANDRFLEMLGFSRAELTSGSIDWTAMTPPEWAARDLESLRELSDLGRNAAPFEKEYFRRDGTRLPVLVTGAMLDEEGTSGIVLVVDISEQKLAEAELRRLNTELEDRVRRRTADLQAANAELESFGYSVSHDLRAPLRHISSFATLVREQLEDRDAEVQHFLDRITQSAAEMSVLIDDLLKFSRVGRAEMHVELVDMRSLVDDVLDVLRSDQGERTVKVTVGDVLPAKGDRTLLRQVWANLLGNAFKYTRPRDPGWIGAGRRAGGDGVVYWVGENGVGFDMQYVDRLFRVFERLHRADEFEGTGIGLANAHRIVGRHDGRCWAESELDGGATFFFALPRG
jgi:PAS domain S-box-containing protein